MTYPLQPAPVSYNPSLGLGNSYMPTQYSSLSNYGVPDTGYSLTGMGKLGQPPIATADTLYKSNFDANSLGGGGGGATPPASTPGAFTKWMQDSGMLGSTNDKGIKTDGWGGLALGAATGIGGLYLGMQQYNLAKDALANNKAQFERNFAAQKTTTNAELEDRQRARVASNSGAYQSVGDYMSQNGIK